MHIAGSLEIAASPMTVWTRLRDADILARAVPTCDKFGQIGPDEFAGTGAIKLGPMRWRLAIKLRFRESEPPHHAVLELDATSKLGSGLAVVTVHLNEQSSGTRLDYDANATFKGQAAHLIGRHGDTAAQDLVNDFFARFAATIPPEVAPGTEIPSASKLATIEPLRPHVVSQRKHNKAVWIGIGAGVSAIAAAALAVVVARNRSR